MGWKRWMRVCNHCPLAASEKNQGRQNFRNTRWDGVLVVQLLSHVRLFVTPWTAAHQAPPSFTISWSLLKFMFVELVILSNHFTLCFPLLLLPSIFPSISVFSNESALPFRWPNYWSFNFSISHSNEYLGLISFRID